MNQEDWGFDEGHVALLSTDNPQTAACPKSEPYRDTTLPPRRSAASFTRCGPGFQVFIGGEGNSPFVDLGGDGFGFAETGDQVFSVARFKTGGKPPTASEFHIGHVIDKIVKTLAIGFEQDLLFRPGDGFGSIGRINIGQSDGDPAIVARQRGDLAFLFATGFTKGDAGRGLAVLAVGIEAGDDFGPSPSYICHENRRADRQQKAPDLHRHTIGCPGISGKQVHGLVFGDLELPGALALFCLGSMRAILQMRSLH
jgi:hypothetical protein